MLYRHSPLGCQDQQVPYTRIKRVTHEEEVRDPAQQHPGGLAQTRFHTPRIAYPEVQRHPLQEGPGGLL